MAQRSKELAITKARVLRADHLPGTAFEDARPAPYPAFDALNETWAMFTPAFLPCEANG